MSQTPMTDTASSRFQACFQAIFDAAVKSYEKRTKRDLNRERQADVRDAHPLASQLHSTGAVLAVLRY